MASSRLLYAGMYDVADDKRRRQLFYLLRAYGVHSQFSVFECWLDAVSRTQLLAQMMDLIDPDEDRVALARLPQTTDSQLLGLAKPALNENFLYIG